LLAAASSNSFADSVLVAEQLVDDLVLVHLLDELEEAAADKVLACLMRSSVVWRRNRMKLRAYW
jgi:hypothetical protein